MAVFVGKIVIYVENVMESTDKLVELSSDSTKVQDTTSIHKIYCISILGIRK